MRTLDDIVAQQRVFAGLAPAQLKLLAGCARNRRFEPGDYLLREGDDAQEFFVLRQGRVVLEMHAPGHAPMLIATLGEGDLVGASWLVPPYRWQFDARALEPVLATGIDAACLRAKAEADPAFGYALMKGFVPVLLGRLQAARVQLFDVYGPG